MQIYCSPCYNESQGDYRKNANMLKLIFHITKQKALLMIIIYVFFYLFPGTSNVFA